ncbi:MAG: RsmB/NOP family class I SAM-dependent RNA methyltransferase [Scardovia wiggsiae]|uniref:RsmB/NOP family class I SAM-dependent RNA methyltransferase n=1 Tax=Scardovia wiggsiae TaxID=230143 RepID=UPI003621C753
MTEYYSRRRHNKNNKQEAARPARKKGAGTGKASNPREMAYLLLARIHNTDAFSNLLVPRELSRSALDARDKAFVTEAVYGSLRWQGLLDAVISAAARRPVAGISTRAIDILRSGVYQILFMGTAGYAAVSQNVDIMRKYAPDPLPGFVNAVLRTVTQRPRQEWESMVISRIPKEDKDKRLSVRYSHPEWTVSLLREAWEGAGYSRYQAAEGGAGAEGQLEAMLAADNEPPDVVLCARPGLISVEDVMAEVHGIAGTRGICGHGRFSPYSVHVRGVDPQTLPSVRQGLCGVEDEGSQLAALALAFSAPVSRGERWLDMCAGPGGKAALLAACAAQHGSAVLANEPAHHRADLVRSSLRRLGAGVENVTEHDGRELGKLYPHSFDRILVDAPCSGLGALRRRPESRWRKKPEDVAALAALQQGLLSSAYEALKPGGTIAYVTCSPAVAETACIVDPFLSSHPDMRRMDAAAVIRSISADPGIPLPSCAGDVQLFEHLHNTDQMFISLLHKIQ